MDTNTLRAQLAPGWSGVNIAIMVVLFLIWWPLGLLMIAYILWGERYGLNLARPQTFGDAISRLLNSFGGSSARSGAQPRNNGTPDSERDSFERWRREESDRLRQEREALERDRAAFEASRKQAIDSDAEARASTDTANRETSGSN